MYCLFFEHLGVLTSHIQQFLTVVTIGLSLRVEFGTILEGLRNFEGEGA